MSNIWESTYPFLWVLGGSIGVLFGFLHQISPRLRQAWAGPITQECSETFPRSQSPVSSWRPVKRRPTRIFATNLGREGLLMSKYGKNPSGFKMSSRKTSKKMHGTHQETREMMLNIPKLQLQALMSSFLETLLPHLPVSIVFNKGAIPASSGLRA